MLVGWDTLEEETYRHEAFPAYQSGREFDDAIVEQLDILPELVAACGFANAKKAGYEADDFLAAAATREEKRGGTALVASGDRDTFQLASAAVTILYPVRAGEVARITPAEVRDPLWRRPRAGARFHRAARRSLGPAPGRAATSARKARPTCCAGTARSKAALAAGRFATQAKELRLYRSIATMDRKAPLPPLPDQTPTWSKAAALARTWQLNQLADRFAKMAVALTPPASPTSRRAGKRPVIANTIGKAAAAASRIGDQRQRHAIGHERDQHRARDRAALQAVSMAP